MTSKIFKFLKNYSYDTHVINRIIVTSYVVINEINIQNNEFLRSNLIQEEDDDYEALLNFATLLTLECGSFDYENLISLFEFVVSPENKVVNGAVYTPRYIREYIIDSVLNRLQNDHRQIHELYYADIACGCGSFLADIAIKIHAEYGKPFSQIFSENIYGLDITDFSIVRTKLLLSLLGVQNGEDHSEFAFNLFVGNALDFKWKENLPIIEQNGGIDVIVGNPPYVSSSKIDILSKGLLKLWSVSDSGKADLYIPFFQIAIENLSPNGWVGYITVNSFFRSLNGRLLREYFSSNQLSLNIIDFKGEQIFKGRSTYTCICVIGKQPSQAIEYIESRGANLTTIEAANFDQIPYAELDNFNGWYLRKKNVRENIKVIESTGQKLGEKFSIKNGFATLQNDIYLFLPISEDANFYYLNRKGEDFKIEKTICRDAIKGNTLKKEADLVANREILIFPYQLNIGKKNLMIANLLDEAFFEENFPHAYSYLDSYKHELAKRDKGNREYEAWYAYGRSQALTFTGNKLIFPYISKEPNFVFSSQNDLLFYNGYAIFSESKRELKILKKILKSKIFWYYIVNASKPYENNYFSLAKNYIKHFGVCELSNEEKLILLTMNKEEDIDVFLEKKYNLSL